MEYLLATKLAIVPDVTKQAASFPKRAADFFSKAIAIDNGEKINFQPKSLIIV